MIQKWSHILLLDWKKKYMNCWHLNSKRYRRYGFDQSSIMRGSKSTAQQSGGEYPLLNKELTQSFCRIPLDPRMSIALFYKKSMWSRKSPLPSKHCKNEIINLYPLRVVMQYRSICSYICIVIWTVFVSRDIRVFNFWSSN